MDWPFLIGGSADGEEISAEMLAKRQPIYAVDDIDGPLTDVADEERIKETTYIYRKIGVNGTNTVVRCFVHQDLPQMLAVQKLWLALVDRAIAKSDGALTTRIQLLERKTHFLEAALRMQITAGTVSDDFLGEAYLQAGGGYEGLQAIADKALKTADEMGS